MNKCIAYITKDGLPPDKQREMILSPPARQGVTGPVEIVKEFVEKESYNQGHCNRLFSTAWKWARVNGIQDLRKIENLGKGWEVAFYTP